MIFESLRRRPWTPAFAGVTTSGHIRPEDYGPGYRVYFCRRGEDLILLLCGGDKSTQDRDIREAKAMTKEIER